MSDQVKVNGVVYSLKYRKCGKPACRCIEGELHGPYWYSRDAGGQVKYVGGKLPEAVTAHVQLLRSSKKQLAALKAKIARRQDELYKQYLAAGNELSTLQALEAGEHCDSAALASLGLSKFNGHEHRS
jgi:hypothetical protein